MLETSKSKNSGSLAWAKPAQPIPAATTTNIRLTYDIRTPPNCVKQLVMDKSGSSSFVATSSLHRPYTIPVAANEKHRGFVMPDILIWLIIGLLFWAACGFLILTVYLPVHVLSRLLEIGRASCRASRSSTSVRVR